ncbi:prolyl oligopeptidase family serine peptidase [Donghicola mangrovi]|uniref:Prolyl oligopeptidase family serine peptidase n=1 Tax=Donghicola mangrovi TaxID=2729614 RepID=A0A850QBT1_9RHOB|nr:prolyl oligopeptidase family serine peptidase [Donghicola mangrovi]NVO24320.1 prolyl oligopeptidase family serine peptidase [Donghicola mangrovi]
MITRRTFILGLTTLGALASISAPVFAAAGQVQSATAITQVFGDGQRFVAVALTYDADIAAADLDAAAFAVEGRTIVDVYPATSTNPADRADTGRYVIVALSPDDADATLAIQPERQEMSGRGPGGMGKIGTRSITDVTWATPEATVTTPDGQSVATSAVRNLIVEDFQQLVWQDPETGDTLPYNLFVPRDYDPAKSYPLVNFMHDAGASSDNTLHTLLQGLGAICWASPEDQAKRPCFVLAPQFSEIVTDDTSEASSMLDTTINLIRHLTQTYSIDPARLYTTGQSGGGMLSIAMNIKHPDFFATTFLVACQWDAAKVAPMAGNRLFILVSQDDAKAFPGQNAITEALTAQGTPVARAVWDARWSAEQFRFAFDDLDAEGARVNYVTFDAGTVIPEGQTPNPGTGHINTWHYAYAIEPIREWVLR